MSVVGQCTRLLRVAGSKDLLPLVVVIHCDVNKSSGLYVVVLKRVVENHTVLLYQCSTSTYCSALGKPVGLSATNFVIF
jgi:hypothetical protein